MTKTRDPNLLEQTGPAPPLKRGQSAQMQRDLRSKAAMKANMARRKAQVRVRDDQDAERQIPGIGQDTE